MTNHRHYTKEGLLKFVVWTVSLKYLGVHIGGGKNLFFDIQIPRRSFMPLSITFLAMQKY